MKKLKIKPNPNICRECISYAICRSRLIDEFTIYTCPYIDENLNDTQMHKDQILDLLDVDPDIVEGHITYIRDSGSAFTLAEDGPVKWT